MNLNQEIISFFEQHPQQYLSGEEISRTLGCSRNAIWKHIQTLRNQGYVFDAVPHKGYKLVYAPNHLSPEKIQDGLHTKCIGNRIHFYQIVDSTQIKAQDLVFKGAMEGEVVIAEMQTAGKGRLGRKWYSPAGKGIWMSLILTPQIPVMQIPQLSLVIAVALCRVLRREYALDIGLKWPNDILIKGKKICGILLESSGEDERVRHIIAGIGMSVNFKMTDYPSELQNVASSIAIELGHEIDRNQLIKMCFTEIEEMYFLFKEKGFPAIRSLWEAYSVSLHRKINIKQGNDMIVGVPQSLDEMGGLVIMTPTGQQVTVYSGVAEPV